VMADNDTVTVYRWRRDTAILISLGFNGASWVQTVGITVPLKYVYLVNNTLEIEGYKVRQESEMEGYQEYENKFHKVFFKRGDSARTVTALFTGSIYR